MLPRLEAGGEMSGPANRGNFETPVSSAFFVCLFPGHKISNSTQLRAAPHTSLHNGPKHWRPINLLEHS